MYFIFGLRAVFLHLNINISKIGATILHDAAVKGQIGVIEWILKSTDLNIYVKDNYGN